MSFKPYLIRKTKENGTQADIEAKASEIALIYYKNSTAKTKSGDTFYCVSADCTLKEMRKIYGKDVFMQPITAQLIQEGVFVLVEE